MPNTYTAVMQNNGPWWVGWIEEIPGINCQERTREQLAESLREALGEMIAFNREEARKRALPGFVEEPILA